MPTQPSRPNLPRGENNFHFLRLLLAILVILAHSPILVDGDRHREPLTWAFGTDINIGDVAVDGFFLISGYLIAMSWLADPSLVRFLLKRLLRIMPGFTVAVLVSVVVVGPLGDPDWWSHFRPRVFVSKLAILSLSGLPESFPGSHYPAVNDPTWTIRFEVACYVLVAGLGVLGLLRRRWTLLVITGGCLIYSIIASPQPIRRFIPLYLAGTCFYLFRDVIRYTARGSALAVVAFVVCQNNSAVAHAMMPILGGYLLFAAAFAPSPLLRSFGTRPDISFGVYLYAWPIAKLLIWRSPDLPLWTLNISTILLAVAAGLASWYAVEFPALRLRKFFTPRTRFAGNSGKSKSSRRQGRSRTSAWHGSSML